jgi:hypothetical protein
VVLHGEDQPHKRRAAPAHVRAAAASTRQHRRNLDTVCCPRSSCAAGGSLFRCVSTCAHILIRANGVCLGVYLTTEETATDETASAEPPLKPNHPIHSSAAQSSIWCVCVCMHAYVVSCSQIYIQVNTRICMYDTNEDANTHRRKIIQTNCIHTNTHTHTLVYTHSTDLRLWQQEGGWRADIRRGTRRSPYAGR